MNDDDKLVTVVSGNRLIVEPIWEKPIDLIEGPLYLRYIETHPGYKSLYVRSSVASMLKIAANNMPKEYSLVLRAGHRPLEVQQKLLTMVKQAFLQKNPTATDSQALEYARTFVSDPAIKLPPHCCGAAVDVDVLNIGSGKLVDFGCPMNTDDEIAFLGTNKLTKSQQANRQILLEAMLGAGFAPFQFEWWHFSYGDQVWADFYKSEVKYGLIEPDLTS